MFVDVVGLSKNLYVVRTNMQKRIACKAFHCDVFEGLSQQSGSGRIGKSKSDKCANSCFYDCACMDANPLKTEK